MTPYTSPFMIPPRPVGLDVDALISYFPIPGFGLLPINSFLIRAKEPVLVDTGMMLVQDEYMSILRSRIDLNELRWIWLTHIDADHIGSLGEVLAEAPRARIVTTFLGMGKLGLNRIPVDRVRLLNPGQELDVGDRRLVALRPPTFDAPETTGLFDPKNSAFFSADSFGALMNEPFDSAEDMPLADLRSGMVSWTTVDSPWLSWVEEPQFARILDSVRNLKPDWVFSSHLVPAKGMTEELLMCLATARQATPFVGPDQSWLEGMLSAGPGREASAA